MSHQQAQFQRDDHHADQSLDALVHAIRDSRRPEHDRYPKDENRARVAHAPTQPYQRRSSSGVAGHGRDRRQMVGIKGVSQAEQKRHREGNQRLARSKRGDFLIEAEHSLPAS